MRAAELSARWNLRPELLQPVVRLAPRGIRIAPHRLPVWGRGRVRTQELHVGLLALQVPQAVRHELVGEMPLELDQKAVVTEALLRGARVQVRQVDRPGGELL